MKPILPFLLLMVCPWLFTGCASNPASSIVEDYILADMFGVTLPPSQAGEIAALKAEVAALKARAQ